MSLDNKIWSVAITVTCVKILLIPSYRSTDFEVHRNWLAITHNLPISKWYHEATSQWTLDYPPLFAWFEYALSQLAYYFDPQMLKISSQPYESHQTVLFQRFTVILTDLFYYYAVSQWSQIILNVKKFRFPMNDIWLHPKVMIPMLFLWNPGLLIVDHIHFQYNGLLSGFFLLSMARMVQHRHLESAFWFAILLNFKHIYLYAAPAYFIYLLRNYCFDKQLNFNTKNFIRLSSVVAVVFLFSFGPFIWLRQLDQVLSRLFPFKRGLSHAYWAPNFWALYNTVDKVMIVIFKTTSSQASMTGGLVQQFDHQVLINITPPLTLVLTGIAIVPTLNHLWHKSHLSSSPFHFVKSVIICSFSSYMFGWHIHEKAILLITLPLISFAMLNRNDAKTFLIVSTVGNFSLFPLLNKEFETPTKILLLLMYTFYSFKCLEVVYFKSKKQGKFNVSILNDIESIYLFGLILVQLFYSFGDLHFQFLQRFQFLPLMLTSFYCSLGLIYGWFKLYIFSWNIL